VSIFTPNPTSVASLKRGYRAALSAEQLKNLRAGLSVLASRYVGGPVHGDIVRMAAQVERIASRAGVR
jgi:hypothetical protein